MPLSCVQAKGGRWANGVWAKVPLDIAAMSDNVMRLVFGEGKLEPRYQKFLDKFQIIIICVDEDRKKKWEKSHFYRRCREDGLNVGFLERPCVATPVFNSKTGKYEYKETELWHLVKLLQLLPCPRSSLTHRHDI